MFSCPVTEGKVSTRKACLKDYLRHYWFSVPNPSKWLTWSRPLMKYRVKSICKNEKLKYVVLVTDLLVISPLMLFTSRCDFLHYHNTSGYSKGFKHSCPRCFTNLGSSCTDRPTGTAHPSHLWRIPRKAGTTIFVK